MFGLLMPLTLIIIVIGLLILAFEIWMFVDAFRNPYLNDTEKILWCFGMLFIHPIIAVIYYFIVYSKRNR